ncbi:SixA phosphatase family protein [Belliella kenyensis]|uniref:SixA phosphatase family protein n=1 Tax=Belliella kenyensis TaxID=1472724 RepID=A0ABV8ELX0_9BACT|nr:histidine phosphatase family protein [Belliella kenyensis]MCH7400219.1 histidine phosphatase family protein [Belliella kenyensis]MDN3604764.1 histidine phosphatase family protein [Belliella kenyensis]
MKKVLGLLRHGEAGFDFESDFQRELSAKGRSKLIKMSDSLFRADFSPQKIISSSATRTIQTTEIISYGFPSAEVAFFKELYEADSSIISSKISEIKNEIDEVLLVGHNPGLSLFVSQIADQGYLSMEPGMIIILELYIQEWSHIGIGTGIIKEVLV